MTATRSLLSWDNGTQPVPRIVLDENSQPYCPAEHAHERHSDAVWSDWQTVEVWDCSGLPFTTLDEVTQ